VLYLDGALGPVGVEAAMGVGGSSGGGVSGRVRLRKERRLNSSSDSSESSE